MALTVTKRETRKELIAASSLAVKEGHVNVFSPVIRELGVRWRDSPDRPKAVREVLDHWSQMLNKWAAEHHYPLLVRKHRKNRGHHLEHGKTKRCIVPCDNAAANWVCFQALSGRKPSTDDLLGYLNERTWPLAQVPDSGFKYGTALKVSPENMNSLGWKVCHIENVGLGGRGALEDMDEEILINHFLRFLNPANMIVVPLEYGGVAESPCFLEAFAH